MSKKQAKRLHDDPASGTGGNAGTSTSAHRSAPVTDQTKSPPVQNRVSARPKRDAVKTPVVELSDSASDVENSSSSEFEADADHISEVNAEELSDLDADYMDVLAPLSNTGELSFYNGKRPDADSACHTVEASATPAAATSRNPSLLATTTIDTAHRHLPRQSDGLPPDRVDLLPKAPAQYVRQKRAKHHPQFWSQLIAEVKPHASLYDRNHPHYRMITKNSPLWVKVAANMGLEVEVAKSKWQNLRDRLAKEHTRFGNRSDWEHYDEAAYLIPFIVFREENRRPDENTDYLVSATFATSSSNAKTDQLTKTQLISEVKRYPSLYDRNHRDYRKVKINSPRWAKIAAQTGLEVDNARSTWQSIRNRLALEHTTFGNQSNWVHYNEAAFLIPFIEYKKRKGGLREAAALDSSMLGEEPTRKYDSGTFEQSAAMKIHAGDGDLAPMLVGAGDGDTNDLALESAYQGQDMELYLDTAVVPLHSATNATQKHARPTRAAAGAHTTQTSTSSRSNDSSSSNGALMMNDKRVSEKVGSVENHADRVPPNILLFGDNVQVDSAQVTIFDCPPPSIPCIGELPKLKLFHDLSNSERAELEKAEGFETQCTFCDPKNKCTSGAPDHDQHFFDDGLFYACTRPGCTARYSNCDLLYNHYALAHDPSLSLRKCDKCSYVATSKSNLESHVKQPHPKTKSDALKARTKNCQGNWSMWKDPWYCSDCGIWYPEFQLLSHKEHHAMPDQTLTVAQPVQRVRIEGLRDASCPFDGCDQPYIDFIGWYLHCVAKHSESLASNGGFVPVPLESDERVRVPMFRCTTCSASVPIGQVQRHSARCAATLFPETLGPLMRNRAAVSGDEPGILRLEYGLRVIKERRLMGCLEEIVDPAADTRWVESTLAAIRRDPFLRSFVQRNRNASQNSAVYTVAKIRRGTIPTCGEWMKHLTLYAGSTGSIAKRVTDHIKNSISNWHEAGLTLAENEDLYLIRMCITIDAKNSVASFNEHDRQRLEQIIIDSLGIGSLYNVKPVRAYGSLLNDSTYRNHLAPRLNQLALILFESTHTQLTKNGTFLAPDNRNIWKLPITRKELKRIVKKAPRSESSTSSAIHHLGAETTTRVDQASSPIPADSTLSQQFEELYARVKRERAYTEEKMDEWTRARRASTDISRRVEPLKSDEPQILAAECVESALYDQRSVTSPDLFADSYPEEMEQTSSHDEACFENSEVPSMSANAQRRPVERLRALTPIASTSRLPGHSEPDESHMQAGEGAQSRLSRQPSLDHSKTSLRCELSETSSGLSPAVGRRVLRIPGYGGRTTQYVDLARAPVELTQDAASETSQDEPQQELSDESSETSDEEPPREILDDSSESSHDEPSPTDSRFFGFKNVPIASSNSEEEPASKKSARNADAALPSDGKEKKEADLDTNGKCVHTNCRRPQHELINWVQCDDCDEWYHSLCILGAEKAVDEDEFHCGCATNGMRKSRRAQHSEKQ